MGLQAEIWAWRPGEGGYEEDGYSCSQNNARGEVDGYVAWQLYVATWVS